MQKNPDLTGLFKFASALFNNDAKDDMKDEVPVLERRVRFGCGNDTPYSTDIVKRLKDKHNDRPTNQISKKILEYHLGFNAFIKPWKEPVNWIGWNRDRYTRIKSEYNTFRDEFVAHFGEDTWNDITKYAMHLYNETPRKRVVMKPRLSDAEHELYSYMYNINTKGLDNIPLDHLVAIKTYTDITENCDKLNKAIKNDQLLGDSDDYQIWPYSHWLRLLKEAVIIFGTTFDNNGPDVYRGINMMMNMDFQCPQMCMNMLLSTSTSRDVAVQFAHENYNTVVLWKPFGYEGNKRNYFNITKYIDVQKISRFPGEMECLFYGENMMFQLDYTHIQFNASKEQTLSIPVFSKNPTDTSNNSEVKPEIKTETKDNKFDNTIMNLAKAKLGIDMDPNLASALSNVLVKSPVATKIVEQFDDDLSQVRFVEFELEWLRPYMYFTCYSNRIDIKDATLLEMDKKCSNILSDPDFTYNVYITTNREDIFKESMGNYYIQYWNVFDSFPEIKALLIDTTNNGYEIFRFTNTGLHKITNLFISCNVDLYDGPLMNDYTVNKTIKEFIKKYKDNQDFKKLFMKCNIRSKFTENNFKKQKQLLKEYGFGFEYNIKGRHFMIHNTKQELFSERNRWAGIYCGSCEQNNNSESNNNKYDSRELAGHLNEIDSSEILSSDCYILRNIGISLQIYMKEYSNNILNKFNQYFQYQFDNMLIRRNFTGKYTWKQNNKEIKDFVLCRKVIWILNDLIDNLESTKIPN